MSYQTAATSSGSIGVTAATVVSAKPAVLCSLTLNPAAAACTVTVYDNATAASGTVLASLTAPASVASTSLPLTHPINALNGITVVVTGTAATAVLAYQRTY